MITAIDRARDTPAPVVVAAAATALFEEEIASNHYRPDLAVMDGSVACSAQRCSKSGVSRSDIDVAMIYDAFSPILLMQLEALGFCGFGEAKEFVADGNLAPGGALPCNTNGGLIGEGPSHGLNLTVEAVRQLRGTACNQLDDPHTALVTASRTGVILQLQRRDRDRRRRPLPSTDGPSTSDRKKPATEGDRLRRARRAGADHRGCPRVDPRGGVLPVEHEHESYIAANLSWERCNILRHARHSRFPSRSSELDRRFLAGIEHAQIEGDTKEERIASLYRILCRQYDSPEFLVRLQIVLNLQHDPDTSADVMAEVAEQAALASAPVRRLLRQALGGQPSKVAIDTLFHALRGFALSRQFARSIPVEGSRIPGPDAVKLFLHGLAVAEAPVANKP